MRSPLFPRFGGPEVSGGVGPRSRALLHLDVRVPAWDVATGAILAAGGQRFTWTRGASTSQSATDSDGVSYTAPAALPAWEARDLDGDSVRETVGLRCGTSDRLTCTTVPLPQAMSGRIDFIETGAVSTADATLFAICNDAVTGARLFLATNGTSYGLVWTDGTTTRTARPTGTPTTNQRVTFWWQLAADGSLSVSQSIAGGAATTATAAALTLPTAWGTGAALRLNSRGDTENPGQAWYQRLILWPGTASVTDLAGRF